MGIIGSSTMFLWLCNVVGLKSSIGILPVIAGWKPTLLFGEKLADGCLVGGAGTAFCY